MRTYIRDMKHAIGFTAILAALLVGMTCVVAGNATAAPDGLGIANERSDFNPAFNRPFFNRPLFDRPAFNPFFDRPAFNPFFVSPAINPFFVRPFFNPFVDVDVDEFGADFD